MLNNLTNFFDLIVSRRIKKKLEDSDLIAIGTRQSPTLGDYKPTAITFADFKSSVLSDEEGCLPQFNFKEGSVGPKVSFRKVSGSDPEVFKDVIIPGLLEITRGNNGGGIYNAATESNFNNSVSPEYTEWNTQYIDPVNTNWSLLWDLDTRTYDTWRQAARTPEGNVAPPQYVGMPAVMKYTDPNTSEVRYWLILFTEWGVGQYDEYGFAYDRWEIYQPFYFYKTNYDDSAIDIISQGVHIGRDSNGGQIYNVVNEPHAETGVSPRNTKWNSIYTDSRSNYSGFSDLSNLESRVYTDFAAALDGSVGNNVLDTDLIMHDLTTDLYYKVVFTSWTQSGNGGGFEYIRTVIPQSCGIKFADGTVLNTAPTTQTGTTCCPVLDSENNLIIDDNSDNLVNVAPGDKHSIPNFSGMFIVNDHFDGRVETWIAGGGDGVLLGYTNVGAGPCTSTVVMNGGINGYDWNNNDNMTGPFTFTVIKTRQGS